MLNDSIICTLLINVHAYNSSPISGFLCPLQQLLFDDLGGNLLRGGWPLRCVIQVEGIRNLYNYRIGVVVPDNTCPHQTKCREKEVWYVWSCIATE